MFARKITRRPQLRRDRLELLAIRRFRHEHDECGQVLVERAEAVAGPRAEAGTPGHQVAGLHEGNGRFMIDRLGMHRANHAHLVCALAQVRQELRIHRHPATAKLRELVFRRCHREARLAGGHGSEPLALPHGIRKILVVPLGHARLRIEKIHLRRAAHHVQKDDSLRLGREVRREQRVRLESGRVRIAAQQRSKCGKAQHIRPTPEESAAGEIERMSIQ